jgi:hypothetical protein
MLVRPDKDDAEFCGSVVFSLTVREEKTLYRRTLLSKLAAIQIPFIDSKRFTDIIDAFGG